MWQDPIVAEVRQAREAHAAQFDFDLWAIYRALKEQEEQSQRKKVSFAPKHIPPVKTEMKPALAA
ncbi:MAG: hypothetical protein WBW48_03495 [Anaerolineae bacterium]